MESSHGLGKQIVLLARTVQLRESVFRYDVTANQSHRRVVVGRLLSQYGAREHGMIPVVGVEIYFDLKTMLVFRSDKKSSEQERGVTGSSSLDSMWPTWVCCMTCTMLINAGSALQPAFMLSGNVEMYRTVVLAYSKTWSLLTTRSADTRWTSPRVCTRFEWILLQCPPTPTCRVDVCTASFRDHR